MATLAPEQRNILRLIFLRSARPRRAIRLGSRRAVRGGGVPGGRRARRAAKNVEALVDELCRLSPEFEAMWRDNDVRSYGDGAKTCGIR